jgi:ribosomal protein S18 acetylase RimI-like enzyme
MRAMDESYPLTKPAPTPAFTLRPAHPDDFDFAWALYRGLMRELSRELGLWHERAQRAMIRSAVNGGEASIILAGAQPVGWLQVQDADDVIYIHQLYIGAEHQGRGIGTAILSEILERARQRSKPVHLWVMRNNARARQLYERLGFRTVDEDRVKFHLVWTGQERSMQP